MSKTPIPGADYVPKYKPAWRTRAQWDQLLLDVLAEGGRRRVEYGETFMHDAQGHLVHEVYANIAAPHEVQS